jgi:CRISPR/Cas system CSM-associated protein Csm3 (group 7 of RAMP superfamily)
MADNKIMTHRYIARFIIQAETPLFVGSGEKSLLKDALVQKDINGLPMIQGTSLAGVLRHNLENTAPDSNTTWGNIFGYQSPKGKEGLGSRLKISSGMMLMSETTVSEGILVINNITKNKYDNLPKRQHVRIDHKGVAVDNGLFDNEVVYKGTKFVFELELAGTADDKSSWDDLLKVVQSPSFRIGSGTRNGYGSLSILGSKVLELDLTHFEDYNSYLLHNVSLNELPVAKVESSNDSGSGYLLSLDLDDTFFIFGETDSSGITDNKPLEEEVAVYENGAIKFEKQTVIPASSIKGALSHRTAFQYNKLKKNWADTLNTSDKKARDCQIKLWTGAFNDAVANLFGAEMGHEKVSGGERGHVIIDDLYFNETEVSNTKIFNHVAIDRFTGGAMDGALFSEKVSQVMAITNDKYVGFTTSKGEVVEAKEFKNKIILKINLDNLDFDKLILESFENALKDICKGLLPLGGMTTKGHGIFTGTLFKNGVKMYNYEDGRN